MHIATFLQDLAVIMIVAGIVTIIFHLLKQPVVLGYILSGVILSRHTPSLPYIHDENTIRALAELGVIFLMFSLGLEFSIRKLLRVGAAALITALSEITLMILVGYEIGLCFGWKPIDSLFLGAMLAISSTTIIIKALDELKLKKEKFAQIVFGILIIEDILAIGMLALLSSIAITGSLDVGELVTTFGKLLVFIVASLVIGILLVQKLLLYITRFHSKEMLLITVLGLCFGFSLLVIKLGYSIALGAFLIGAIIAESNEIKLIEHLIQPITNMFSAIFFVSIGLLVDPVVIQTHLFPIIIITCAVIIGKVMVCSLGAFLAGKDGKTSMRVGMGLAQIGEFSFIIASLGISLKVMSPFLYPIIVAVSAITTFLTPYLIKSAEPFVQLLTRMIPDSISRLFNAYTVWLHNIHVDQEANLIRDVVKKGLLQLFINLILIIAFFIVVSYLAHQKTLSALVKNSLVANTLIWGISLVISLPFLIAIYRKVKALSMVVAEMSLQSNDSSEYYVKLRHIVAEIIPMAFMLVIALMIVALSASILPPLELLLFVLVVVIILAAFLWRFFIRLHSQLQILFIDSFRDINKKE